MKLKCVYVFDSKNNSDFTIDEIYEVIEIVKNCFVIKDNEGVRWSVPLKGKLYEFELIK